MQDQNGATTAIAGTLSIGTVAKLTGISVHTLRAWEKRHNVVEVLRSDTGRRMYSTQDVHRLKLLRKLTLAGHSIGNVASLNDKQLEDMLDFDQEEHKETRSEVSRISVCLYSDRNIDSLVLSDRVKTHVEIASKVNSLDLLQDKLAEQKQAYCVVMVVDTIQKQQLRYLRQLISFQPQHTYYLVFTIAQREVIDELSALGFMLVRAPITYDQLFSKVIESYTSIGQSHKPHNGQSGFVDEVPPHQYTQKQVEYLAKIPSAIDCECPKHLADLVRSLTKFESYSQHCQNVNKEDAHLHNEIYKLTAQARSRIEKAISLVVESESISLDNVDG